MTSHTAALRRRASALALALLTQPAAAAAQGAASPWDGTWALHIHDSKRAVPMPLALRGVAATSAGERLVGRSDGKRGWSVEIDVVPAGAIALCALRMRSDAGNVALCAGSVDRGNMAGTCYLDDGRGVPFALRPVTLASAAPEERPVAPPQPPAPPATPQVVVVTPPPAPAAPPPSCGDTLLAKGHHPTHLRHCKGAEPYCAVTLLERGHHPTHLDRCGHDLEPQCVQAVLARGHHPTHLRHCRGVDAACAVALLDRGHHPAHLKSCR